MWTRRSFSFCRRHSCGFRFSSSVSYENVYKNSCENPEVFWGEQAATLSWTKKWKTVLGPCTTPTSSWFPDGEMNICFNTLDVHIQDGRGEQPAIIFESGYSGETTILTYSDLLEQVSRFSELLRSHGCIYKEKKEKMVLIYMANSIEAVIAMLACARNGVTHSVVFGGFAAKELAIRINHCEPSLIIASSCGIEPKGPIPYKPLLDEAMEIAGINCQTIIFQRPECRAELKIGRDFDWAKEMARIALEKHDLSPAISVPSTHPLYVLYTSGTTGQPKGIVRDTGGYATALKWSMSQIYGMNAGDVFWASSDVGWVVGHSYIVYAPLLQGCTTLIFEGKPVGTPDAGAFWRLIQKFNVKALFCAPTVFRAIKKEDPEAKHIQKSDLSCLRALFLAGERADPDTIEWASEKLQKPVIDHYWQTESGWAIASNFLSSLSRPIKTGSSSLPVPGYKIKVMAKEGVEAATGILGSICVQPPLPPGCFIDLFKNKEGIEDTYFHPHKNLYNTGDSGYVDEDGYLFIMTRTGDIINVAGHRLSTGGLEEVLTGHPHVVESAVVGINDSVKGQAPFGFVVLSSDVQKKEIIRECMNLVRTHVGAVASFKDIVAVNRLPKTRSGKILRGVLQKMVNEEAWTAPATIEDYSIFSEIQHELDNNK